MNRWTEAEILLAAAVLALAMPREDGFILPERRDWRGTLRRMLLPRARRQREEEGQREADDYVAALNAEPGKVVIRQDELPRAVQRWMPAEDPRKDETREQRRQRPPWRTAAHPALPSAQQEKPVRRAPRDPPTVVIEMRKSLDDDLFVYLDGLPGYPEESGPFFVPQSALALGAPDHDGAPGRHQDDRGQPHHLDPGEEHHVPEPEVDLKHLGGDGDAEGNVEGDQVASPPGLPPGPEE